MTAPHTVVVSALNGVDSEHVRFLHDRLFEETTRVAAAYGIEIHYDENRHGRVRPQARFSTLQDLDAGRPLS